MRMKKVFTLAVSVLLSSSIFAAAEFFVKVNSNGNYSVSLNKQLITSPNNIFRFFDLYPGNYTLRITESGYNGKCLFEQRIFIQDGFRTVAEADPYRGLSIIDKLPFVQRSWYVDNILSNTPPISNTPVPPPFPPYPPFPGRDHDHDHDYDHFPNHPRDPYNSYPGYGNGYGYNGNLMDDASMQSLVQTMKNATFDDNMLKVARTALKDRQLKTAQVHQLLGLLSFERNKLDLAEFCYDKTIDRNNYYTLYNDFTFSSYTAELDKYINSH